MQKEYEEAIAPILSVYEIFKDFYGEALVDLQGIITLEEAIDCISRKWTGELTSRRDTGISMGDWDKIANINISSVPEDYLKIIDKAASPMRKYLSRNCNVFILVWFPLVTITNEHNRSTEIQDLYAKVNLCFNGSMDGKFTLNRATYSMQHMASDYMHSHVSSIPKSNFKEFMSPCTGSGPINDTISSLSRDFDADLWQLFCLELSKYVTVESIAGTPYKYLEKLGTNNMSTQDNRYEISHPQIPPLWFHHLDGGRSLTKEDFVSFLKYLLEHNDLKYGYSKGAYIIGLSHLEVITLVSNTFITWYNINYNLAFATEHPWGTYESLLGANILRKCKVANNQIYYNENSQSSQRFNRYVGKEVCTFKGNIIKIKLLEYKRGAEENESIILHPTIISYIINKILMTINYEYSNNSEGRTSSGTSQGVRFL